MDWSKTEQCKETTDFIALAMRPLHAPKPAGHRRSDAYEVALRSRHVCGMQS